VEIISSLLMEYLHRFCSEFEFSFDLVEISEVAGDILRMMLIIQISDFSGLSLFVFVIIKGA
jgi:hypothetical protein